MRTDYTGVQPEAENDRLISALSYILAPLMPIVVLVTAMKGSRFNRIHAYQGLVFFGAALVFYVAYSVLFGILTAIAGLLACVLWVGYFVPPILALYLAFRVLTASQVEFPYLTQATRSVFKDM